MQPAPFERLDTALSDLLRRLARATRDRRAPWHNPVIATVGRDGAPRARVMVLRHVEPDAAMLRLHTDGRAAKVAELAANPAVALLFYDAPAKLQLRLEGRARIETEGETADSAWTASRPFSRRCYMAPVAPGTTSDHPTSGLPAGLEGREPTLAESEAGRCNFSVMLVEPAALEFLYLAVTGHRRGRFERAGGDWEGRWLVP